MANNLLYFPYINLPKTDWTVRTLLYYETIASIVPMDFFYEPERNYDPFMLDLVKQELVIPINPIERLENPWELNKPFIDFIQSDNNTLNQYREIFRLGEVQNVNRNKFRVDKRSRVSSQKFDGDLLYYLSDLGLAKHSEGNWYSVEKTTANYLMAYLASVLAGKLNMLPATDQTFSTDFLEQFRGTAINVRNRRDKILEELIPMPTEIDLTKLLKFKDKNFDTLNVFKNIVEQVALNPLYEDEKLLSEKLTELKFQKELLTAKMNESKLGTIFFGTACGIFGAFQGLAQAETTGAILGGLPGFASAIYAALKIEKAESTFDQTGLKYLALVDKRLRNI